MNNDMPTGQDSARPPTTTLVGKWRQRKRSKNGVSHIVSEHEYNAHSKGYVRFACRRTLMWADTLRVTERRKCKQCLAIAGGESAGASK